MSCSEGARALVVIALVLIADATVGGPLRVAQDVARAGLPEGRALTRDGLFKRDPVFRVRAGKAPELVFSLQVDSIRMVLARLEKDGKVTKLHPKARQPEFKPSYSKDGEALAFLQSRGNQNLTLAFKKEADAEGVAHLDGTARNPAIFPDGESIALSQPGKGGQQIVRVAVADKKKTWLTESPSFNNWPSVSPDGKWLAWASDRDGDFEIYVRELPEGKPRRVTTSPRRDLRPAWSPDGRHLVFTSARSGGQLDLYLVPRDGGPAKRLTRDPGNDDYAAWHPSGKSLVYVSERRGRTDLYELPVVPPPESAPSAATSAQATKGDPESARTEKTP